MERKEKGGERTRRWAENKMVRELEDSERRRRRIEQERARTE